MENLNIEETQTYLASKVELYIKVYEIAEREFYFKYYSHMKEFNNILGIFKKILFYKNIDYSQVYSIIGEYNEKLNSRKIK